jgi:HAD superfamily hydrolase (TIGR01484 family)
VTDPATDPAPGLRRTREPLIALATDYDGTLATHGFVDPTTRDALRRLRVAGWQLVMVTGRVLPELMEVFPELELFDLVVAENGALLYRPEDGEERLLAAPPPAAFVEALRARGVQPLSIGRVIVATLEENEEAVTDAIEAGGHALEIILNKGSVMVLPAGVDKASGLQAAVDELGLPIASVVGVGDAENDGAFLDVCGYSVAVANALPELRDHVDLVTRGRHGEGVEELIASLLGEVSDAEAISPAGAPPAGPSDRGSG